MLPSPRGHHHLQRCDPCDGEALAEGLAVAALSATVVAPPHGGHLWRLVVAVLTGGDPSKRWVELYIKQHPMIIKYHQPPGV